MTIQSLDEAIYATLSYFSIFKYPLSALEIWQYLFCFPKTSIKEVEDALENSCILKKQLEYKDGLYSLRGKDSLRELRMQRYLGAEKKFCKLLFFARFFALLPWIRLMCVVNSLSYSNAREHGDIDLFIITEKNHLWFVRFLCTVFLHLCGQRPGQGTGKDSICLSFFIDDSELSLARFLLPLNNGIPDIHFALWFTQCVPIYDRGETYNQFIASQDWVEHIVPNRIPYRTHERRIVQLSLFERMIQTCIKIIFFPFGILCEQGSRWVQMNIFPEVIKTRMNRDTTVVVNRSTLKFHLNDRREEIRQELKKILFSNKSL